MSTTTVTAAARRHYLLYRLYQYYILDSIVIVREEGLKMLIRKRGLKFFGVICAYYLVRDTLLYIVLPLYLARALF